MKKTMEEIAYDVEYIKGHELQPKWFKIAKIFILVGAIGGYSYLFGWSRTIVFVLIFLLLNTVVHYTYRIKTERYTRSWLDFRVREVNGKLITEKIGKYYYLAIILNAMIAVAISQILSL